MSTQPNPLQQAGPWGVPGTTPSTVPGGGSSAPSGSDQGGFFSRLGAGLKKVMPYVTPIANRLAAAAGNYGPLELEHQQRAQEMEQQRINLQGQLNSSQLQNQELNRQLLQKQVDNYRTPEQAAEASLKQAGAIAEQNKSLAPPTRFPATTEPGQPAGLYEQSYDKDTHTYPITPATVNQTVPNPTQAPDAGIPAPLFPLQAPSPTVVQRKQLLQPPPQGVTFSPSGIDMDPNSPTYGQTVQFVRDKAGNPVKTIPSPAGRGVLDVAAPMVTNSEHAVTQPTGEITKENFTSTRQRLLPGKTAAPVGRGGGSANTEPGNLGHGPVVGGKVPTPVTQAFANVQDARNRIQVMQRDIQQIDANPTGNTGSMDMDLLSQHVALTFGTVKNARGGEALIMHHIDARSLPEGIVVMYNHLKSGGMLSPEQRQNFLHLAQSRLQAYAEQYGNAQKEAQGGFGMNPNAPPTMPSIPSNTPGKILSPAEWAQQHP